MKTKPEPTEQPPRRRPLKPSELEKRWRAERASMGALKVPEVACAMLRGVKRGCK